MSEYETKLANEVDILKAQAEPAAPAPEQSIEHLTCEIANAKQNANELTKHNHEPIPADAALEAFAHLTDDQTMVSQAIVMSKPSEKASHDNEFREGVGQDFVPDSAMVGGELADPPRGPDDYFGPLNQATKKNTDEETPSSGGDDDDDGDSDDGDEKPKKVKKPRKPKAMSPDDYAFYIPD